MLLSQVKIDLIDNYKTLVGNWININCFVLRVLEILTLVLNRFRHLHFNYFKVKTAFNRAKEDKKKAKSCLL